jgi:hypothetical protein
MSLLSSFLASHLIPALETALMAHEPDVQAAILDELAAFSSQLGEWLNEKLNAVAPAAVAPVIPPVA